MTIDFLVALMFGLVAFFALVIVLLVVVRWRDGVRILKQNEFLIKMMFPSQFRKNANTQMLLEKQKKEAEAKAEKELKQELEAAGFTVKPGQSAKGTLIAFLNSDQIGNPQTSPRPDKE